MNKIKKAILRIFPSFLLVFIKESKYYLYRLLYNLKKINSNFVINNISTNGLHTFFGYYDITPFNPITDEIVYLVLSKDRSTADVCLRNLSIDEFNILARTCAWNWQQGSRLRWLPNDVDRIVFNDYCDGKYIARIVNVRNGEEISLPLPLYDIDQNARYGLSLDFRRLGVMRPGYGYTVDQYVPPKKLDNEGIDLVHLKNGVCERILTYEMVATALKRDFSGFKNNYINHISFSPSGDKFLFFWLEIVSNFHKAFLLVFDLNTKKLQPLELEYKVSHYCWIDNETILATAYDDLLRCRYYRYSVSQAGREVVCNKSLKSDGHPSMVSNDVFVTDTYPDRNGFQQLLLCSLKNDSSESIASIYSVPVANPEERTDLHPRLSPSKKLICFDANIYGKRNIFILMK